MAKHNNQSRKLEAVSLLGAVFVANGFRPGKGKIAVLPGFFASWMTTELAPFNMAVSSGLVLKSLKTLRTGGRGRLALATNVANVVGLALLARQGTKAREYLGASLAEVGIDPDGPTAGNPNAPLPVRREPEVIKTRDVTYAEVDGVELKLDVVEPKRWTDSAPLPAVVQIHGGAWVIGDKREQGIPLLNHLAKNGYVGFNVNYRLSPKVAFPEHLIDVKRAIAWIRDRADTYGIDPNRIAVTGGSAGGHLTALAALTENDPRYQPGFEEADTSVAAAVPFYGVYDFTNEGGEYEPEFRKFLERTVMKASFDNDRSAFEAASPLHQVHPEAPPFLVIHGTHDSLVPVGVAQRFVARLRSVSKNSVAYAELPGAQHAFEIFRSARAVAAFETVERFLDSVVGEYDETTPTRSDTKMRVVVDYDLCESNAVCMAILPEVFEVRDDDFLYVLNETPDESHREKLVEAVERCPKQAISIAED